MSNKYRIVEKNYRYVVFTKWTSNLLKINVINLILIVDLTSSNDAEKHLRLLA